MKTVSVLIPAFNEEKNIKSLLWSILNQKGDFLLEKILIVSDASTDHTVKNVKEINSPLIQIVENKERKGKWFSFEVAKEKISSDVIISLDADIAITDTYLFDTISKEVDDNILLSIGQQPLEPINFFQKILFVSQILAKEVLEEMIPQTNILLCNGRCLAFSKKTLSCIKMQPTIGTDVFIFLQTRQYNTEFKYLKNKEVYFKLPKNFKDHLNQSIRAWKVQEAMSMLFKKKIILQGLIQKKIIVKKLLTKDISSIIFFCFYTMIKLIVIILTPFIKKPSSIWTISESTK